MDDLEKEILFVCVQNAGRSQMAQAFAEKYGIRSASAGTVPASKVNPIVVEAMKEKGIDIANNVPKMLTPDMIDRASLVVTMGCSVEEVCPKPMLAQMQKKLIDWELADPKGKTLEEVRKIRDDIEARVILLKSDYVKFKPIGIVHRDASDDEVRNRTNKEATIEIYPGFEEALDGLEGFSHIFVIAHFHKLRPEQIGPLKVKPKGMLKYGLKLEDLPQIGVLALDSPTRPNPIGLSLVRLLRIEKRNHLVVSGLDFFDGTPVLDIKPYQSSYRVDDYSLPEWHKELSKKAGHSNMSP